MAESSAPRSQPGRTSFRSYRNPVLRKNCMAHTESARSLSESFDSRTGMHLTSSSVAHENMDGGTHVSRDCQTNRATELLARKSEGLCSILKGCSRDVHHRLIVRRNVVCGADLHVAKVVKIGERKHSGKLLAQSRLHGRLHRVNTIFAKSARFDIPIEDENLMPRQGYLLCANRPAGPAPL